LWIDLRAPSDRRTALLFLHRRLLPLPPEELATTVFHIEELLGAPAARDDDLTMTVNQLLRLASLPLQEVGAHTQTHAHLATQPAERQRQEVLGSVADLESLLHRPVRTFAYPFGGPGTVGALAQRLVADAGCGIACTTSPGPVRRRTDRYRLPRLTVLDWEADEFAARLSTALGAR
jgi:peptidoglycan/xylan/chitin deacetylase (PgdA/CDA1 family)